MPARSLVEIKTRKKDAEALYRLHRTSMRDAYRYALPQRDLIDKPSPGRVKGQLVFDSTAVTGIASGANRVQAAMFPPQQDFVTLEPGPTVPRDRMDEVVEGLHQISEIFHASIRRSNFDIMINEFLLDLFIGTGTMLFNEGPAWNPFIFSAVPGPWCVYLEEGVHGTVGGVYRDHKLPVSLVEATWPGAKLPADWLQMLQNPQRRGEEVVVSEACYHDPNEDRWYYEIFTEEPEHKFFNAPQVWEDHGPWIVTRWLKAANEVWGRGPVLHALADIRTANKVVELTLKNAALSIAGVYTGVDDGVLNPNTVKIVPGAVIPVARNEGPFGPSLMPLPRVGDFDVAQLVLADLRQNINRMLFNHRLPPDIGSPRTATEIIERQRELQIDIGPAFSRLVRELMTPLVMRGLNILQRLQLINFPLRIDGNTVQVTVTSPLAQQNNLQELEGLMTALAMTAQFEQFLPGLVAGTFQPDQIGTYIASKLGVDPDLLRGETDRARLMQRVDQMIVQTLAANQAGAAANGGMQLAA